MKNKEVRILSTGKYLPPISISNRDLSKIIDTNDNWIKTRTGIEKRRITKGENTSDLGTKAALDALRKGGISAEELDLIIVATITPDYFTPSTACIIQRNIKAYNAFAFDISAACSGFTYGISIASQFIRNGVAKKVLVIGVETLSKLVNWKDRNTCILFGDGSGAAILTESNEKGIMNVYLGSDGRGADLLKCKSSSLTVNSDELKELLNSKEEDLENKFIEMDGKEIFKFAVKVMIKGIEEVLKDSNLELKDINYIIPHQANLRIIEHVAKKLGIDENKFYININHYGNTSAASIPIALAEVDEKGLLKKGDNVILVGFGAGLTWAASLIKWI
ncbi:beta-ketoacyl-ACP synthase III [Clostridium tetani]|uniref:Beta-ketoacyl-[acyl-carrier-protein] synthase III n=1 Tax=Clostridium tetani TaxID=1513 RepID=A0A4Q0VBS2_CLOTA|nr:beta-ketoacyl-ACP synthase III [Clostridium tetani]KGI43461.1 3-oxoacyl-ACP synthase [Clostridium tetani]RXI46629.1 ketoacyl-ACP synthase III [Clostridium tetani]RXI74203.1 ketoacyl-ACP synthase III [Clostridium tetani]BDR68471.1 3-oxoacyl-[acyl-carrier-protein] synthase 3 [Clostridium tetani]BDR74032.1 3-oxoacyl-[acyl-carrier-protein] synthase 3 [Clostridium tetani]